MSEDVDHHLGLHEVGHVSFIVHAALQVATARAVGGAAGDERESQLRLRLVGQKALFEVTVNDSDHPEAPMCNPLDPTIHCNPVAR